MVQNAIASALNNSAPNALKNQSVTPRGSKRGFINLLLTADPNNATCADCGAADPEWASINLGILICIKCSGIHRQLGTHISKVRSTTLDTWDKELRMLMLSLGNTRGNEIFEFNLPPNTKITEEAGLLLFFFFSFLKYFSVCIYCIFMCKQK